jgi:pyruvate/2-oxoglutarate dehydrogenase complex dihydrolipoamide acyltransferase (E2) component
MRIPVKLPQFGESAAEATIMAWLVEPGATVSAEQDLVEVQTEKSVLTVASPAAGKLLEHAVALGDKPQVGDVLAWLECADGTVVADATNDADASTTTSAQPTSAPAVAKATKPVAGPHRSLQRHVHVPPAGFLSPRLRMLMDEHGLQPGDLSAIKGTGEGGRITADDLENYLAEGSQLSPLRQAIATGMMRSWSRPLATAARPVKLDPLLAHRRTVDGRPSATVYALRALALALKDNVRMACRLVGTRLNQPKSLDLGVAVEVDDGVLTPVIRAVDTLSLAQLSAAIDGVLERARTGKLKATDSGDAVCAVTNYGTFGLTWATPIPQPGHATILGIGAVQSVPDWNPGTKTWDRIRQAELTLTFDHRIADGGAAARLLMRIAELMEHPEQL